MSKKIRNIFYLLSFFIFIVLTTIFYFSEQNVVKTNKSRTFYSVKLNEKTSNLPLLKNNTSDIIEYRNYIEVYKKNKKNYTFWDLIRK